MRLTLFCRHSDLVTHLLAEVDYLRGQLEHERQRAEMGVDRLLGQRGIGPITTPTPTERHAADARQVAESSDFDRLGESE